MGRGSGVYGTVYSVGGDNGLDARLLDLLQMAFLPEVGIRFIPTAEGTGALDPESAFCVVPDHTRTGPRERLCQGDGHASGGGVVARVRRVDCETVTDGPGQEASRIG